MKKLQKISLALAICSISAFAVGCSTKETKDTKTEKKEEKVNITSQELVKKVTDATNAVKCAKVNAKTQVVGEISGKTVTTDLVLESTMTKEPYAVKFDSTSTTDGESYKASIYFTQNDVYLTDSELKEWVKINEDELKSIYKKQENSVNFKNIVELLEVLKDKIKVEQEGSNFVVTYTGNDDEINNPLKNTILSTEPAAGRMLGSSKADNLEIKVLIDKNTFIPVDYDIKTKMTVSEGTKVLTFDMSLNFKYSEINEVKEIVIPDDVKNAKDFEAR